MPFNVDVIDVLLESPNIVDGLFIVFGLVILAVGALIVISAVCIFCVTIYVTIYKILVPSKKDASKKDGGRPSKFQHSNK